MSRQFTQRQQAAIDTDSKRVLVVAGPGSGKSTTLVARIRLLIDDGNDSRRMVAITFTNAAARELEHKLDPDREIHGPDTVTAAPIELGHVGTLHSFALRMLKEYGEGIGYGARLSVVSPESASDLLWQKAQSLGFKGQLDELLKLKAKGRPLAERLSVSETIVASFFDDLRAAGIVDFDLILSEFLRLLKEGIDLPFDFLFVDEVQDSAAIDWAIYEELAIASKFYVGDPDQNLYTFRGARVDIMLKKAADPAFHVIALEENFRSHSEITDAAQKLIENNSQRIAKKTVSVKGKGGCVYAPMDTANAGAEIAGVSAEIKACLRYTFDAENQNRTEPVAPSEIAVIGRTNAIVNQFKKTLTACGIPVAVDERQRIPLDWTKARALVELLVHPENDTLAGFYIAAKADNVPEGRRDAQQARQLAHGNGMTINDAVLRLPSSVKLSDVAGVLQREGISRESRMIIAEKMLGLNDGAQLIDLALAMSSTEQVETKKTEGVRCLTIHGCKGLEFDVVFIVGCEQQSIPGTRRGMTPQNIEEERRCFFVAVTRARKAVYFSYAEQRETPWGAIQPCQPSQFLREAI